MNTDAVVTGHVKDNLTVMKEDQSYFSYFLAIFSCVDRKQKDNVHWRSIFFVSLMFIQC